MCSVCPALHHDRKWEYVYSGHSGLIVKTYEIPVFSTCLIKDGPLDVSEVRILFLSKLTGRLSFKLIYRKLNQFTLRDWDRI